MYFYSLPLSFSFFFFNDTATTEIYTLSLHDALPISSALQLALRALEIKDGDEVIVPSFSFMAVTNALKLKEGTIDRKSTRLNSSHDQISYAVFCLKKKKQHCFQNHCLINIIVSLMIS